MLYFSVQPFALLWWCFFFFLISIHIQTNMTLLSRSLLFCCTTLNWIFKRNHLVKFWLPWSTIFLLSRVLKVFLSRTAQRIPYMTSCRVLRLLSAILLIVLWFLVAWTSAVCQNRDSNHGLVEDGVTLEGLQFTMCTLDRWDDMMAVGWFLNILLWN